jgi:arginyl-tRNA synthetase
MPEKEAINQLGEIGLQIMIDEIRKDLAKLGVVFDCWFSERSLYNDNHYQKLWRS